MQRQMFQWLGFVAAATLAVICCCAPRVDTSKRDQAPGTYLASRNRLYEDDGDFDLLKTVVWRKVEARAIDPDQPTADFAVAKCTLCHECGFPRAWDLNNLGKAGWRPRYRGDQWEPIVQRMRIKENSQLNEAIALRVYNYLRDASLGKWDAAKDNRNAVVREVDELPSQVEIRSPGNSGGG